MKKILRILEEVGGDTETVCVEVRLPTPKEIGEYVEEHKICTFCFETEGERCYCMRDD